jgi:hypothetical protein
MLENERKQIEFFKAALKCQPEPLETLESIIEQERTKREAEELKTKEEAERLQIKDENGIKTEH